MEDFIAFIRQFGGNPNISHSEYIRARGGELRLDKGMYFSEAGRIPRQVGYLVEGVLRTFAIDDKGEEVTRYFIEPGNLVVDYLPFQGGSVATDYIAAATECRLVVFQKPEWEEILRSSPDLVGPYEKIIQSCLIGKLRKSPVISQDATTRYREFLKTFPGLVNRVPLAYVASYLGITQQSLSRIRKNMS